VTKKQIAIFLLILFYLLSVGSAYAFNGDTTVEEPREHSPQRKIERELKQLPDESFLEQDDRS